MGSTVSSFPSKHEKGRQQLMEQLDLQLHSLIVNHRLTHHKALPCHESVQFHSHRLAANNVHLGVMQHASPA